MINSRCHSLHSYFLFEFSLQCVISFSHCKERLLCRPVCLSMKHSLLLFRPGESKIVCSTRVVNSNECKFPYAFVYAYKLFDDTV